MLYMALVHFRKKLYCLSLFYNLGLELNYFAQETTNRCTYTKEVQNCSENDFEKFDFRPFQNGGCIYWCTKKLLRLWKS